MNDFSRGDLIWYVYGMPGYDTIVCLVLKVEGQEVTVFDPFLQTERAFVRHPNTGHSVGDCGTFKGVLSGTERVVIEAYADRQGITKNWRSA